MTTRTGMLVDARRCISCHACSIACKAENEPASGVSVTRIEERMSGKYPAVAVHLLKRACMHCGDPICVRVCPSSAMSRSPGGAVGHDPKLCIGCGYCAYSCPFEVPKLAMSKAHKCTMCTQRLARDAEPACVATCPTAALSFGDYDTLSRQAADRLNQLLAKHPRACIYNPAGVGGTSVRYVLDDEPARFGLAGEPKVSMPVEIWQALVKPFATWLIPLALLGTLVSFVTTRIGRRKEDIEEMEEGEG